jgi:hypothetical protein
MLVIVLQERPQDLMVLELDGKPRLSLFFSQGGDGLARPDEILLPENDYDPCGPHREAFELQHVGADTRTRSSARQSVGSDGLIKKYK